MTALITEILLFLATAAVIGLVLGYLIWGWGQRGRMAQARAEGAARARTSVDGGNLRGQLDACRQERSRLEREVTRLQHALEAEAAASAGPADPEPGEPSASEPEAMPAPEPLAELDPEPAQETAALIAPTSGPEPAKPEEPPAAGPPPASLLAERPDEVDNLKRIKGVGPKMERILNGKGVYLFKQDANFTPGDVSWVNEAIDAFPGRIERDDWVGQAQNLYRQKYGRPHDADD